MSKCAVLDVRRVSLRMKGFEEPFRDFVGLTLTRMIRLNGHPRVVTSLGFDVERNLPHRSFEGPIPGPGTGDRTHGRKVLVGVLEYNVGRQ